MQPPAARGSVAVYYYQCDQIGTPQYLSGASGDIAVEMSYKAWGEAREVISEAAKAAGITNPLRFQGQYFDAETGVHYNRYRYYDPQAGRFISKDPIGLDGGLNPHQYARNPVTWIDPLGLLGRRGALRQAKRDAGIPMSQQPDSILSTPMTTRGGCPVICQGKRVQTKEYLYTREDGSQVVIQDHRAGHQFGEGGVGDQGPHFNVRPAGSTRNGSVAGTAAHYPFE